jgi:hypothetical protein
MNGIVNVSFLTGGSPGAGRGAGSPGAGRR